MNHIIECPNETVILAYARRRGMKEPSLVYQRGLGWELRGDGLDQVTHDPLCWMVANELGISKGCGGSDYQQIAPEVLRVAPIY